MGRWGTDPRPPDRELDGDEWLKYKVMEARKRERKRGVALSDDRAVHYTQLPWPPVNCPLCGKVMLTGAGVPRNDMVSLDELVPGKGYGNGNGWWICQGCNQRKAGSTPADWELLLARAKELRLA